MKWRYLLKRTVKGSGSSAVCGEKISPASKRQFFGVFSHYNNRTQVNNHIKVTTQYENNQLHKA